jgi:hypothetical protein
VIIVAGSLSVELSALADVLELAELLAIDVSEYDVAT